MQATSVVGWAMGDGAIPSAHLKGPRVVEEEDAALSDPDKLTLHTQRKALLRDLDSAAEARRLCDPVSRSSGNSRRIGVCVTGQLSRLETESKLRHLIEPSSKRFVIDVVLVVSGEGSRFINGETEYTGGPSGLSARSVASAFGRSASGEVVVDTSPQEEHPYVQRAYLNISDKPQLGEERVRSHVRQWAALMTCYKHFAWLEAKRCASGAHGEEDIYGRFIKLRDDSLLINDWDIGGLLEPKTVALPDCLGYSGYNDKVALLDANAGEAFFTKPLYEYLFNFSGLEVHHGNPEHVLRRTLEKHAIPVKRLDIDDVPIFTSRYVAAGKFWCVIFDRLKLGKESKCWPRTCEDRSRLFCLRCPTRPQDGFVEDFFQQDLDDPSRPRCPMPSCSAPGRARFLRASVETANSSRAATSIT